jgi:hypothetical protein
MASHLGQDYGGMVRDCPGGARTLPRRRGQRDCRRRQGYTLIVAAHPVPDARDLHQPALGRPLHSPMLGWVFRQG